MFLMSPYCVLISFFQFWSVYVDCSSQYSDSVRVTLDQFDTVKRFVDKYSDDFMFVTKSHGRFWCQQVLYIIGKPLKVTSFPFKLVYEDHSR